MEALKKTMLFLFGIALMSCGKDPQQVLVEGISGAYNIQKLRILKSNGLTDSATLNMAGTLTFESCKIKDKDSRGNCPGAYTINGEPMVSFMYHFDGSNGVTLQPNNTITVGGYYLLTSYAISEQLNNKLVLKSKASVTNNKQQINVILELSK